MHRFHTALIALVTVSTAIGCSSLGGGGLDDDAAIAAAVAKWSEAMVAHDLDALMPLYSDAFSDADGNSKDDMRDFLADVIDQGMLDDLEVDTEDAVLELDGDSAVFSAIYLTSALGSISVDLTFAREQSGWMIVSMFAG